MDQAKHHQDYTSLNRCHSNCDNENDMIIGENDLNNLDFSSIPESFSNNNNNQLRSSIKSTNQNIQNVRTSILSSISSPYSTLMQSNQPFAKINGSFDHVSQKSNQNTIKQIYGQRDENREDNTDESDDIDDSAVNGFSNFSEKYTNNLAIKYNTLSENKQNELEILKKMEYFLLKYKW